MIGTILCLVLCGQIHDNGNSARLAKGYRDWMKMKAVHDAVEEASMLPPGVVTEKRKWKSAKGFSNKAKALTATLTHIYVPFEDGIKGVEGTVGLTLIIKKQPTIIECPIADLSEEDQAYVAAIMEKIEPGKRLNVGNHGGVPLTVRSWALKGDGSKDKESRKKPPRN